MDRRGKGTGTVLQFSMEVVDFSEQVKLKDYGARQARIEHNKVTAVVPGNSSHRTVETRALVH